MMPNGHKVTGELSCGSELCKGLWLAPTDENIF